MKVLLVNGSPHKEGCTYTALSEVGRALEAEGIEAGTFWIGVKPLSGCIACKTCVNKHKCVFDDTVNEFLDIAGGYDGFVNLNKSQFCNNSYLHIWMFHP